jgi:hypothetical protein
MPSGSSRLALPHRPAGLFLALQIASFIDQRALHRCQMEPCVGSVDNHICATNRETLAGFSPQTAKQKCFPAK